MKTGTWMLGCFALTMAAFDARAAFSLDAPKIYSLPRGERIQNLAVGDVDGDGHDDIVAVSLNPVVGGGWSIYLIRQWSSGRLARPTRIARPDSAESYLTALRVADLDHDGRDEIIAGGQYGVFSISFASTLPTVRRLTTAAADEAELADFDGDGNLDLVVFEPAQGNIIFFGDGNGGVDRIRPFGVATQSIPRVAAADLNGDGRTDYVIATDRAYVYFNRGLGQGIFNAPTIIDPQFGSWQIGGVAIGDFSGDGLNDLILGRMANSPTWIATYRQSQGALVAGDITSTYDVPADSQAVDIDGDGRSDLVVAHDGWTKLGVYMQGASGLRPERLYSFPGAYSRTRVETGDMDSDGCSDVIANSMDEILVYAGIGCVSPGDLSVGGSLSADSARVHLENVAPTASITDVVANVTLLAKQGVLTLQALPSGCIAVDTNSARANIVKIRCSVPNLASLASTDLSMGYALTAAGDTQRVSMTVQGTTATAERALRNNVLFRSWTSLRPAPSASSRGRVRQPID